MAWNALLTSSKWKWGSAVRVRNLSLTWHPKNSLPIDGLRKPYIPKFMDLTCNMNHLCGWITVGTPFLHYRSNLTFTSAISWFAFYTAALGALVSPAVFALYSFYHSDKLSWADPKTVLPVVCGVTATIWLLWEYPVSLCHKFLSVRLEADRSYDENIDRTQKSFCRSHSSIWSRQDEAINALRAVLQPVTVPIVPRMRSFGSAKRRVQSDAIRAEVFDATSKDDIKHWIRKDEFLNYSNIFLIRFFQRLVLGIVSLPWRIVGWFVNTVFLQFIDRVIYSRIKNSVVGNDLAAAHCKSVNSHPFEHFPDTCIEENQKTELFEFAIRRDGGVAVTAREILCNANDDGIAALTKVKAEGLTTFLVHNQYFAHEPTRRLIFNEVQKRFQKGPRHTLDVF